MEQKKKIKIQIWSKFEGEKPYMYGEYDSLKKASEIMTNFIFGTERNHEYTVKIIEL